MAVSPTLVRELASEAGFDLVRFGPIDPGPDAARFAAWLDAGRAGEMDYLHRNRERIMDLLGRRLLGRLLLVRRLALGIDLGITVGVLLGLAALHAAGDGRCGPGNDRGAGHTSQESGHDGLLSGC